MHEVATISAKKMQATGHTTSRTAGSPLDVCQHPCPALCGMRCTSGPCMEHGPDEQVNCEASGRRLVLTSSESSLSPALDDSFLDVQIRRKQEVLRLRCLAHGETSEETVFAVAGLSNPALNPSGFFEHTCWKSPPAEFSLLTSDHRRIAAGTASNSTHAIAGDTYHATRRPSSRQFSFANSRVHGLISRLRSRAWSENSPAGVSSCFSPSRGVVKGATRSSRRSVFSQKNGGNTREKLAHLQEGARAAALKQLDASASGPVENGLVSGSSLDSSEIQKGQEKTGLKGGKPKRQLMHAPESKVNVYNWLFHSRFRNSFGAETAVLSPAPAFHVPETETRAVAEEIEESTDPSRFLKHSLDASSDSKETSGGYHGERVLRQNSERLPRARGTNSHRHNALRRSPCDLANGTEVSWSNPDASVESVQAGISNWHADFFTTGRENPLHSCREKDEDRTPVVASLPAPHHGGDTREREVSLPARRDLDGGESKGGSKGERELSGSHTELSSFPSVQGEASRCVRFPVSPSCHTKEIDGDGMLCTHSQTSTTGERKREPLGTADSAASCGFGDSETEDRKRFSSNTQQDPATHGGVRCCDKKLDPRSQARQQSTTSASQCVSGIGACLGSHPLTAAAHASRIKRVDTRGSTQQLVSDAPSPSAVPGLKPVEHTRTRMPAAAAAVQGGPTFLCRERNLGTRDRGSVLPSSRSQAESTDFGGELGCAGQSSGAKTQSASSSEGVVCQTAGGASSLGGMLRKRSSFETSEGVDSAAEPGNLGHLSRPRGAILSLAGGTECADNSRSGALGRSSLGRSFSSLSSSISFLLGARRPERRTGSLSRSQAVAPVLGDGATTNNREVVCADVHLPRCLTSPEEEEEVKHRLRHRSLGRALPPGAAGRPTAAGCSPCCPGPDRSNELHSLARGRSSPSATAAPLCAGSSVRTDTLGSYSSVSAAAASSSVSGPEFLLPDDPATTLGQTKSPDFTSFSPRLASFLSTRLKTILINYPPPQPRVLVLNEKDSVGIFLRALHEKRLSSCVVRHAKRRFGVKTVYSFADARDFCYLVMRTLQRGPSLSFREMLAAVQLEDLGTLANISRRSPFIRHTVSDPLSTLCGSFIACSRVPIFNGGRLRRVIRGRELLAIFQNEGILKELDKQLLEALRAAARISVCSIRESESLLKAMVLMERHGYSAIPIVSERCDSTVVEMLTVTDIQYLVLAQQELRSDHIMNDPALEFVRCVRTRLQPVTPYVCVRDTVGLSEIIAAFLGDSSDHPTGVKRVFLTDERGKAKGMLTVSKLLEILANAVGTFSRVSAVTRLPPGHPAHNRN